MAEKCYGFAGKTLRIDLSNRKAKAFPTDMPMARQFLGGRGFNMKRLYDEIGPGVDPRGEENKYFIGTGMFGGTHCAMGTRINVSGKSPQTGIVGDSNAGTHFAADLKFAGYDQVIIEGKSEEPVYLFIDDDEVTFRDARALWGKSVSQATLAIRAELGDPSIQVLSTGVAADHGVNIAGTFFNLSRASARTGTGSILGSKNVKAVAVRGTGSIEVFDPALFHALNRRVKELIRINAQYEARATMGTTQNVRWLNEEGFLTVKHFQNGYQATAHKWEGETLRDRYNVKSKACFGCSLHCSRYATVGKGTYKMRGEGPEYEAMACFASRMGSDDPEFMLYANRMCNEYGMDEIAVGEAISWLMELNQRGIISSADADGLDLSWGNHETALALMDKMAHREGIGDLLADGIAKAAERLGRGSSDYAMEVKGLEIINGEPRGMVGYGLTYATADRGGDHLRSEPYFELKGDPEIGEEWFNIGSTAMRLDHHGKGCLVKWSGDWCAVSDGLEVCKNTLVCMDFIPYIAEMVNAATGWDVDKHDLQLCGERIVNVERCFNVREGIRRADDRLPKRFTDEPMECEGRETEGNTVHLEYMLEQYYRERGWDPKTSIPTPERLRRLSLTAEEKDMQVYRKDEASQKAEKEYRCTLSAEELESIEEELVAFRVSQQGGNPRSNASEAGRLPQPRVVPFAGG